MSATHLSICNQILHVCCQRYNNAVVKNPKQKVLLFTCTNFLVFFYDQMESFLHLIIFFNCFAFKSISQRQDECKRGYTVS